MILPHGGAGRVAVRRKCLSQQGEKKGGIAQFGVRENEHAARADAQLQAAGVGPDLIRLSVGIEDPEDICWDLDQALLAAQKGGD